MISNLEAFNSELPDDPVDVGTFKNKVPDNPAALEAFKNSLPSYLLHEIQAEAKRGYRSDFLVKEAIAKERARIMGIVAYGLGEEAKEKLRIIIERGLTPEQVKSFGITMIKVEEKDMEALKCLDRILADIQKGRDSSSKSSTALA